MTNEIVTLITDTLLSEIKGNISIVIQIVAIAFICSLFKGMEIDGGTGSEISRGAFLVEYALVAALLCTSIMTVKNIAVSSINDMTALMNGITPVLLTSSVFTGSLIATAGAGSSFIAATQIVANGIKYFFIPASIIIAVLVLVDNLSEKVNISNFVNLVKNIVLWGLGAIMTIYIALLSVQSIVSKTSDSALNKTVKFAAGSMIPFVGQYLSDSLDAVTASAVAVNSAAGTGAMIAIITATIVPAIKILIIAGLLKLSSAVIQPISNERITKCVGGTASAFSLMAGLTIVCAAIFTITIGVLLNNMSAVLTK